MSRLRRQMSYSASLSTWFVTSVCSRSEWTQSTVLYGSTHADEICGHDQTVKTRAVVRELAQAVEHQVNDLLTDGVVATGEV